MDERDVIRQKLAMALQMNELQRTVQEHEAQLAAASTNIKHLRRLLAKRNPDAISKEMRKDNERKTKEIAQKTKEIEQLKRAVMESKRKIALLNQENHRLKQREGNEDTFDDEFAQILVGLEAELVAKDNAIGRMKRKLARHNIEWRAIETGTSPHSETKKSKAVAESERFITDSSQDDEDLMSAPVRPPKQRKRAVKRVRRGSGRKHFADLEMREAMTEAVRDESDGFAFGDTPWASDTGRIPRKQKVRKLQMEVARHIRNERKQNVTVSSVKFCGPSSLIGGASDSDSESDSEDVRKVPIHKQKRIQKSQVSHGKVTRRRSASPLKGDSEPVIPRKVRKVEKKVEEDIESDRENVRPAGRTPSPRARKISLKKRRQSPPVPEPEPVKRTPSPPAKGKARVVKRKPSPRSKDPAPTVAKEEAKPKVAKRKPSPRAKAVEEPKQKKAKEPEQVQTKRKPSPRSKLIEEPKLKKAEEPEQVQTKRKPSPKSKDPDEQKPRAPKRRPSPKLKEREEPTQKVAKRKPSPKPKTQEGKKLKTKARQRMKDDNCSSTTEQSTEEIQLQIIPQRPSAPVIPVLTSTKRTPSPQSRPEQKKGSPRQTEEEPARRNSMWRKPAPMQRDSPHSESESPQRKRKQKANKKQNASESEPIKPEEPPAPAPAKLKPSAVAMFAAPIMPKPQGRPLARTLPYAEQVIEAPLILRRRGPSLRRPPSRLQDI